MKHIKDFDRSDVIEALEAAGYTDNSINWCRYAGKHHDHHTFVVIGHDENEDVLTVTDILVDVNDAGEIVAEFPGNPRVQSLPVDDLGVAEEVATEICSLLMQISELKNG